MNARKLLTIPVVAFAWFFFVNEKDNPRPMHDPGRIVVHGPFTTRQGCEEVRGGSEAAQFKNSTIQGFRVLGSPIRTFGPCLDEKQTNQQTEMNR